MAVAVASEARTTGREAAVLPESIAMKTRMRGWWVKHKTALLVVLLVAILGVLYLLAEAGYDYSWTGFGSYAPPQPPIEGYQREKTTWDWLQLLFIPLVLAVGGFFLNRTERVNAEKAAEQRARTDREIAERRAEQERRIAERRAQDEVLETYLDRMSELLVEKQLLKSQPNDEVRGMARIRTLPDGSIND